MVCASMLRIGSAFAGIGGFDLAFQRAGCTIVWQIEIDKFCLSVLNERFPNAKKYRDVREVKSKDLESVDIICGGFPCQNLSTAGNRKGLDGGQSGLWWEFVRIVAALHPTWVVVENVTGMLSSRKGWDMGAILRSMGNMGYWWAYRVLDAQWFGLPQRRKRVFIVGCLRSRSAPAKVLLEPEGRAGNFAQSKAEGQKATGMASESAKGAGVTYVIQDGTWYASKRQDGLGVTVGGSMYTLDTLCRHAVVCIADTLTAHYAKSPTTAGKDSSVRNVVASASGIRRLTPLECERLQGFPDGWTCLCGASGNTMRCKCPVTPRYRALGNAVAVPVVEWIARRIVMWERAYLRWLQGPVAQR
jgi:DNA (cytosine-5)-methyltransferase 1